MRREPEGTPPEGDTRETGGAGSRSTLAPGLRPRIVFLGSYDPYGSRYGATLRTRIVVETLREIGVLTFVPVAIHHWSEDAIARAAKAFEVVRYVRLYQESGNNLAARLSRNLSPRCMDTDGFVASRADRVLVDGVIDGADLVWVHGLLVANGVRRWRWDRTVMDVDDVSSRFHRAHAAVTTGATRLRALWRARIWRRRERLLGERFPHVVVCSEEDCQYLRADCRVHIIPNTFDDSGITIRRTPSAAPRFGFVGTFEYEPNREGLEWFAVRVWPEVRRILPAAELRIVGRGGRDLLRHRQLPGTALDYVEDPAEEMATWTAMIVPIRFGGGTRVKIGEAFARRIPVVSTRFGAFGYEVIDGRELLLGDTPSEFANACVRVFREAGLAERLTAQASVLYRRKYASDVVRQRVAALAGEALRSTAARDVTSCTS